MTQWLSDKAIKVTDFDAAFLAYAQHVKSLNRGVYPRITKKTAKMLLGDLSLPRMGYEINVGSKSLDGRKVTLYIVNVSGAFGINVYYHV